MNAPVVVVDVLRKLQLIEGSFTLWALLGDVLGGGSGGHGVGLHLGDVLGRGRAAGSGISAGSFA